MLSPLDRWILLAHVGATLFMVGVIWFVQVVHYPLYSSVSDTGFAAYEARHVQLTSWVVGPAMLTECATLLFLLRHAETPGGLWLWLDAGLLLVIWLSTLLLQIPCHQRLEAGFDASVHRFLVASNWIRTVAWSARGGIVLAMVGLLMKGGY